MSSDHLIACGICNKYLHGCVIGRGKYFGDAIPILDFIKKHSLMCGSIFYTIWDGHLGECYYDEKGNYLYSSYFKNNEEYFPDDNVKFNDKEFDNKYIDLQRARKEQNVWKKVVMQDGCDHPDFIFDHYAILDMNIGEEKIYRCTKCEKTVDEGYAKFSKMGIYT